MNRANQQAPARLVSLRLSGYRSINSEVKIQFPEGVPVVLLGENNAGKSNIVRALDLVLGEFWAGNYDPDDHEYWNRDPNGRPISIEIGVDGVMGKGRAVSCIRWDNPPSDGEQRFRYCWEGEDREQWMSREVKDRITAVVIGADRKLAYQLGYSSKYTLLARLMRRFHTALVEDPARVEQLKAKFGAIVDLFSEVEEFAGFQGHLREECEELIGGMTYGLNIDFSAYDPSNYFHSLKVSPHEGTQPRTFGEMGTGQEQVLAIAFAHAYARAFFGGIVLIIEEPEAHLHPLAQEWLGAKIREMCQDGLQVVLTTHSPAFVDIPGLDGAVLVRKDEAGTRVVQQTKESISAVCVALGAPQSKTTPSTVLPFYAAAATPSILAGFFARSVVLVEGTTEALSLPVLLRRVDFDTYAKGVAIVPVMGKGNLAKWYRLFTAFEVPCYVIFDNDAQNDPQGTRRTDVLRALGESVEDVISSALQSQDWVIRPLYSVFGNDYETALRAHFEEYLMREGEFQDMLGESKPLIARRVADVVSLVGQPGTAKLRELCACIDALGREEYDPFADE